MKRLFSLALIALLVLPAVVAQTSVGTGINPSIGVEDFAPRVWACQERVAYDDQTAPGRLYHSDEAGSCTGASGDTRIECEQNGGEWTSTELFERINNYAFEGEQVSWTVLVMDKNKIDQFIDVYATLGPTQGDGNDIEVNCQRIGYQGDETFDSCNARIDEEYVQWDADLMDFFSCTLTVETPESHYGEYWVTVEAMDGTGLTGTMDENEYWFFNPLVALSVDGFVEFENVRPGTDAYSNTIRIVNDADFGSGVLLDLFISGTDFYDSTSSGARCPNTNQLGLSNFRYFATNGAFSTADDVNYDVVNGNRETDVEGYVNIDYGVGFNNPEPFYNNQELIQAGAGVGFEPGSEVPSPIYGYWPANVLAPGASVPVTFKLSLPEPCNGNFDTGSIYFWGEAI